MKGHLNPSGWISEATSEKISFSAPKAQDEPRPSSKACVFLGCSCDHVQAGWKEVGMVKFVTIAATSCWRQLLVMLAVLAVSSRAHPFQVLLHHQWIYVHFSGSQAPRKISSIHAYASVHQPELANTCAGRRQSGARKAMRTRARSRRE